MAKQVLKILLVLIPVLVFIRCAQIVPLSGGKRDLTPPKLLAALPASNTTHFNSALIVLEFDEYVKITDLANQLTVSPRLKTTPEVEVDRKTVKITLKKEELAPNTTYRIAFGKAIVDMTEGNALQNLDYVLSTGDFIDSLKIKGSVSDAYNGKPAGGILIALYTDHGKSDTIPFNDSLPYKEAPDYTSRSGDNGEFTFGNLPYKTVKAFAYDDKNKNGLYDGETEKIAFLNSDLILMSDTALRFRLFQEESSKSFIKKTLLPYPGLVQLLLNKKQHTRVLPLNPRDSAAIYETRAGEEKDTISVYYKNISDTLGLVVDNQVKADTLKIALLKKPASRRKFKSYTSNASANVLGLNLPLTLTFLNWMNIQKTEPAELRLTSPEDSTIDEQPVTGRWLDINRFEITNPLKEGVNYTLKIDTCTFFDVNDLCNDSSRITFKTESKLEFGKVTLKLLLNKKQAYTIQLINDKDEVIKQSFIRFSLSSSNAASIDFTDVRPGIYLVKIIFDDNENHKWDTGNLILKQQPERVIINSKQIKVLSDWEIEEEISVKE